MDDDMNSSLQPVYTTLPVSKPTKERIFALTALASSVIAMCITAFAIEQILLSFACLVHSATAVIYLIDRCDRLWHNKLVTAVLWLAVRLTLALFVAQAVRLAVYGLSVVIQQ